MAALAGVVVPRWFTPRFLASEPEQVETVVAMLKGTSPEGYAGCGEAIAALDLRPQLASVKAPTLVVSGAEDVAAPPSVGAYTARNIHGARLTVIQAASHFAHYEKPGPVTDALLTHFQATAGLTTGPLTTRPPSGGRAHRLSRADGDIADDRRGRGRRGGAHAVRAQDGRDRARDPRVTGRRGVQAVARPGERPPPGERVHDDDARVRRACPPSRSPGRSGAARASRPARRRRW